MGGGRSGGKKFIKTLKKNTIFENNELKIVKKKCYFFNISRQGGRGRGLFKLLSSENKHEYYLTPKGEFLRTHLVGGIVSSAIFLLFEEESPFFIMFDQFIEDFPSKKRAKQATKSPMRSCGSLEQPAAMWLV